MATRGALDDLRDEAEQFVEENWDLDLTVGEWWERLARSGLGFPTWPTEWFGKGLDNEGLGVVDAVFRERRVLGAPGGLGQTMGGPVLMRHGDRAQQDRYLFAPASGQESWCQFFSEPGSGSDLASAQTRAVRDGDEWVVNGQKVWTSGAMTADRGMLVARVDMDAPKHRGLGYFIIPVEQPGIEIRPLKQMTGESHFNEVFFTDARVSDADLVGRAGDGWAPAVTTLAFERSGRGGVVGVGFKRGAEMRTRRREMRTRTLGDVVDREGVGQSMAVDARNPGIAGQLSPLTLIKSDGANRTDPIRQDVTRYYVQARVNTMTQQRARAAAEAGKGAGPASSITKLARSVATRINRDLGPAILGAGGMLTGPDAPHGGAVAQATTQAPSTSIAGGTDEIQHNIIGERVLGLPREPQVDRDVPFKDLKVGTVRAEGGEGDDMTDVQLEGIEAVDGWLRGPVRTPRNRASSEWQARRGRDTAGGPGRAGGNIHDDATAQKLGFRGGTIAGSIHLDQFPPVVVTAFGERWFEEGSISMQFRNATIDAEPVVAMVKLPDGPAPQVEARMERTDGLLVAEGTVGCGGADPTYLDAIDLRPAAPDELRLLASVRPGSALTERTFSVEASEQRKRIEQSAMTEPLGWYTGPSPWGPPIVNPSAIVQLIRNGRDDFGPHIADAVGLFSAIELRFHSGPLRCDTEYRVSGEIVAVGASPKTEYVWYDSRATSGAGEVAVSMRMQLRWMKASSPLYADG